MVRINLWWLWREVWILIIDLIDTDQDKACLNFKERWKQSNHCELVRSSVRHDVYVKEFFFYEVVCSRRHGDNRFVGDGIKLAGCSLREGRLE